MNTKSGSELTQHEREIIETADGSKTLFIPDMDEQYHSVNGAITESEYVFLKQGYLHHPSKKTVVFEVGFGTGLNALLTALKAEEQKRPTTFYTIEKYPVTSQEVEHLEYGKIISGKAQKLFFHLHEAPWEETIQINDYFSIHKIKADLTTYDFKEIPGIDIVYFDAFGPDKQSSMWQTNIFETIYNASAKNSTFVTYSAKGVIRRSLQSCGYSMERLPGPPGKRQMLRGTKN